MSEETIWRIKGPITIETRISLRARMRDPSAISNTVSAVQLVAETFCESARVIHGCPGDNAGAIKRSRVPSTNVYGIGNPLRESERSGVKPWPASVTSIPPLAMTCAGNACEMEKGADSIKFAKMLHVRNGSC